MILAENKKTFIFSIALYSGFFLPHNKALGLVVSGLLPVLLFIMLVNKKRFKLNKFAAFFVLVIYTSFIVNVFIGDNIETKSLLRILSLSFLFGLFPFCDNVKIPNNILYIILGGILLSQLAFTFGISSIVSLIDSLYPYEGDLSNQITDNILSGAGDIDFIINRRYGGIYRNSNQLARYVSVLFLVYLIENRKKTVVQLLPFFTLVVTSILLAGSRTGFIVIMTLSFGQYYFLKDKNTKSSIMLTLFFLLAILFFGYMVISEFDLRVFKITSGLDDSIGTKFDWFLDFFNQLNSAPRFLLGHFSTDNLNQYGLELLDSEWGVLFYSFGLLKVL